MLTPVPFVVTTVSRLRDRPPRVSTLSFSPCRNPIYPASFRIGIGLCVLSHTHPLVWPYMRFLCVTSGVCRRLPSSCTSQCTTCLKLGLGPISPTTGLAPARTTHMSCARKRGAFCIAPLPNDYLSKRSFSASLGFLPINHKPVITINQAPVIQPM